MRNRANYDARLTAQKIRQTLGMLQNLIDRIDAKTITVRGIRAEINRAIYGPLTTARIRSEFMGVLRPQVKGDAGKPLPQEPPEREVADGSS